ncbi:MAG: 16S rRNA (cytosine(1402)-N(4))-methyltransferase, partial [Patescibacteria group bacterium]
IGGEPDDLTAKKIVNEWPEEELARIIYEYGDERASRKIAKAIVTARRERQITTTSELVKIIENVVPRRGRPHGRSLHPATKTFQALRVAVNDELEALQSGLNAGWRRLKPGGTIAVITFQGLEGKIFKEFAHGLKAKEKVTLKKLAPTRSEVLQNPRARSAHLRTIKKLS